MLNRDADINAISRDDHTALHMAAVNGHTAVIELLLDRGALIDAVNKDGWTPLLMAALYGREKL